MQSCALRILQLFTLLSASRGALSGNTAGSSLYKYRGGGGGGGGSEDSTRLQTKLFIERAFNCARGKKFTARALQTSRRFPCSGDFPELIFNLTQLFSVPSNKPFFRSAGVLGEEKSSRYENHVESSRSALRLGDPLEVQVHLNNYEA